ncbi:hypothetical protein KIM372_09180 [Bombiscardovia nodaiensis]|uniref:DUF881 domain-containing protein n=1 Tax=Bombiscardovia nodaiensis TaxID=2932181 RepID=A0ABN6SCZ3_9BIFI|nr:hypothetical protein KIM372_09180 [Bombiscardovia nodaiensis]
MSDMSPLIASFPVPQERALIHRRAVFSSATSHLGSHFVVEEGRSDAAHARRRHLQDESLRLIDDLTNRPVDPLFDDARLMPRHQQSAFVFWFNRVVVFLICAAVGIGVTSIVQVLHQDPRQKVREKLIAQIQTTHQRSDDLQKSVTDLRTQIDTLTGQVGAQAGNQTSSNSDIVNGSVAVHGPGVTVTLTNPMMNKDSKDKNAQARPITDADLQWLTTQLWSAGAEAIAVNGIRIGTQTSIRLAGQTVLVGTDSIESPYKIEAIGDQTRLANSFNEAGAKEYLKKLRGTHSTFQISNDKDITLKAAGVPDLTYAQKGK